MKYENGSSTWWKGAAYSVCILERNPRTMDMPSPLLSSSTWMLSHVSWCVRWGLAFACERSKLRALTAAYLWNSSNTTLILFRLALSSLSLPLSLSPSLAVCVSLIRSPLLLCVVKFAYLSNFPELSCLPVIRLWGRSVCGCEGVVGVSVNWWEHLACMPVEQVHNCCFYWLYAKTNLEFLDYVQKIWA